MLYDDVPRVLEIERMSFTSPWSEAAFLQEIHKHYALSQVAEFGHEVIGYMCINYLFDEGHILNLAVHPDFRRQGVATFLMKGALNILKEKGCRFFYLEVRVSNLAAKTFYERLGFRVVAFRKRYYVSPEEDAALMTLET
jgi:[ribosomal protein S18]-alanine N-acetyltransferase